MQDQPNHQPVPSTHDPLPPSMVHFHRDETPDVGLCGTPLRGARIEDDLPPDCVVCQYLNEMGWGER
jgi:hypothetical protein